jgi:hypothetical protein
MWSILSAVNAVNLVNAVNPVKYTPPPGGMAAVREQRPPAAEAKGFGRY